MIAFPNCKINLGLTVGDKREDGFHNIETIFYPIPLKDALEVIDHSSHHPPIELTTSGLDFDTATDNNLCVKAYQLLKTDFQDLPSVKIHLLKSIPMGAGLGGGSADAAFTLMLLNNKYKLNLSREQLIQYALRLGSDCPFFVINEPCAGFGRGEILSPIMLDLSRYQLILVNPGIHVNTGKAFSMLNKDIPTDYLKKELKEIVMQPITTWKAELINVFEKPVFDQYPDVKELKEVLYKHGALYASMSGSGSSVFGFFDKNAKLPAGFPRNYFVWNICL